MPQLDLYLWNFSIIFYFILFFIFYFFVLNFFLIKIIKNFYFRKFVINKIEFDHKYLLKFKSLLFEKNLFNFSYLVILMLQKKYIYLYTNIFINNLKFIYFNNIIQNYNIFKNIIYYTIIKENEFIFFKFLIINLIINEKFF